jgi:hypothetical protein
MHCSNHPAYKGATEIKRLQKCEGCRKVRQAWLTGVEQRKNRGKGSQFSITTPGFRCGVAHLMAELGTVMLYGQQPAFFWRQNVKADPRAKVHFQKTYNFLNIRFKREPTLFKTINSVLWSIWEEDFHKQNRSKEHKQSIELVVEEKDSREPTIPKTEHLKDVRLNPLLYEDIIDGEES